MKRRNFMRFFEAKEHGLQPAGNPLFPHKEKVQPPWLLLIVLILSTFALGSLIAALFGPWLKVRTVTVHGTVTLPAQDFESVARESMSGRRFLLLPGDHRWFVREPEIQEHLLANYPLKSVEVTTKGAEVAIRVMEDVFMIAFWSGDTMLFLDRTGAVLREVTPEEKAALYVRLGEAEAPADAQLPPLNPLMPIIRDKDGATKAVGDDVYESEAMTNLVRFDEGLRELSVVPKYYETESPDEPWFMVRSDKEYAILFDAEQGPTEQLKILKTVLEEYFANQPDVRYVDIRFGQRVYVR